LIVVDTNVLAALWLPGHQTRAAERALRRDSEWAAPLLWRSELRNVLATLLRRGDLDLATALEISDSAEDQLAGREFAVPSAAVLRLTDESRCTAYDCEFVALALELGVPLVTNDRQLLRAFPERTQSLTSFGT